MKITKSMTVAAVLAVLSILLWVHGPADGRSIAPEPPPRATPTGVSVEPSLPAPPDGSAWREAAAYRAEGSYSHALEIYDGLTAEGGDARWLAFLRADSTWRALSATGQPEDTGLVAARDALARLAEPTDGVDRIVVESLESLGDFYWMRPNGENWNAAWTHYS